MYHKEISQTDSTYPSLNEESFTHVLIKRKSSQVLFHCQFDNNESVIWKNNKGKKIENKGR